MEKYIKSLKFIEVEWILNSLGIVKSELDDDPNDEKDFTMKRNVARRDDVSDDDEDKDDREYSWKIEKKNKYYN